jgi:hypothetical protein
VSIKTRIEHHIAQLLIEMCNSCCRLKQGPTSGADSNDIVEQASGRVLSADTLIPLLANNIVDPDAEAHQLLSAAAEPVAVQHQVATFLRMTFNDAPATQQELLKFWQARSQLFPRWRYISL